MIRLCLISFFLISCSIAETTWSCPNPDQVQLAALDCVAKTRMYASDCYDQVREIYCSKRCIANCGESKMSGGPPQINWLPDGGSEKK